MSASVAIRRLAERQAQRCAYCHDAFRPGLTLAECRGCGASVHAPCAADLVSSSAQGCATLGCRAPGYRTHDVPASPWARATDALLSVLSVLLVLAGVAALSGGLLLRVVQTLHGGLIPW